MVMQEENHKKVMIQPHSKSDAMVAFATNMSKTALNFERPRCKHCGKFGHDETNYFELIGYLPRWTTHGGGCGCARGQGGYTSYGLAGRGRGTANAYSA